MAEMERPPVVVVSDVVFPVMICCGGAAVSGPSAGSDSGLIQAEGSRGRALTPSRLKFVDWTIIA